MMAIDVPGAVNLRDVGGLPAGGGRVRSGVLYRSGTLAGLGGEGAAALKRLGIARIIDLRAEDEVAHAPSRTGGIETVHLPLFLGSVRSFFTEDIGLEGMYRALVEQSADRIVRAVRSIAEAQPVLVHCTAGKDRTGVTVALALAAAGADPEAVVTDYARTESLLPRWRNREIVDRLRRTHPAARHVEELATRSPAPVMSALLEEVAARHGSAAGYLIDGGLTEAELAGLREALIEPSERS